MFGKRGLTRGIIILGVLVLIVVGISCFVLFFNENSLSHETTRVLESNADIKSATVINESVGKISLADSVDLPRIKSIQFTFFGDDKYNMTVTDFKKDYEVLPTMIGLESFGKITRVEVSIIYNPVNYSVGNYCGDGKCTDGEKCSTCQKDCGKCGSPGGGDSGCKPSRTCAYYYNLNKCGNALTDGCDAILNCQSCTSGSCVDGNCVVTPQCTSNGCTSSGTFCDGNLSYTCTLVDGCYNRANLTCGVNQECVNGIGCRNIIQCTTDANCTYAGDCVTGKCNLSSGTCYADFKPATTVCRSAVGLCGLAENCTGNSATCPMDNNLTGTVCRASQGLCDVAEFCQGNSDQCPTDLPRPAGFVCRLHLSECDADEVCSGTSTNCPVDVNKTNGATCVGGTCQNGRCTCTPNCVGKQCGSDGCSAWGCGPETATCTQIFGACSIGGTRTCVGNNYGSCNAIDPRTANCAGKQCGSDGCGGSCGPGCLEGQYCNEIGQCYLPCSPSRTCSYYYGLNQCGTSLFDGCANILNCQTCSAGQTCQSGQCVAQQICNLIRGYWEI